MWYKRRERQYRISLFFSAASLAGAFGGILAYVGDVQPHGSDRMKLTNFKWAGNWENGRRCLEQWMAMDFYSCASPNVFLGLSMCINIVF